MGKQNNRSHDSTPLATRTSLQSNSGSSESDSAVRTLSSKINQMDINPSDLIATSSKKKKKKRKNDMSKLPPHEHQLSSSPQPINDSTTVIAKSSSKKKKKRTKPPSIVPTSDLAADKDRIWNTSSGEERRRIKEFWLSLSEDERRSLVKIEKEAVLRKMKEQQKHSCSCSVCGRKRTAIEEELEVLYDAYYQELEQYANQQQQHQQLLQQSTDALASSSSSTSIDYPPPPPPPPPPPLLSSNAPPSARNFFNFGNSLTVRGGILTVADDLLKNDGKKFIDMMEQLAERRMAREEDGLTPGAPDGPGIDDDDYFVDEDEDEDDDEEEEEDDECDYDNEDDEEDLVDEDEEAEAMTGEQRMEEGRRMFQIFAARMFEQRVLTAYRERVAQERQQRLLEELEEEDRLREQRELKKNKEKERKKDKRRVQKQQKEEERLKREAEKVAREAELKAQQERKLGETRIKAQQREAERRQLQEQERLRKEEDKKRQRQAEEARRATEKKEKDDRLRKAQESANKVKQQKKEQAKQLDSKTKVPTRDSASKKQSTQIHQRPVLTDHSYSNESSSKIQSTSHPTSSDVSQLIASSPSNSRTSSSSNIDDLTIQPQPSHLNALPIPIRRDTRSPGLRYNLNGPSPVLTPAMPLPGHQQHHGGLTREMSGTSTPDSRNSNSPFNNASSSIPSSMKTGHQQQLPRDFSEDNNATQRGGHMLFPGTAYDRHVPYQVFGLPSASNGVPSSQQQQQQHLIPPPAPSSFNHSFPPTASISPASGQGGVANLHSPNDRSAHIIESASVGFTSRQSQSTPGAGESTGFMNQRPIAPISVAGDPNLAGGDARVIGRPSPIQRPNRFNSRNEGIRNVNDEAEIMGSKALLADDEEDMSSSFNPAYPSGSIGFGGPRSGLMGTTSSIGMRARGSSSTPTNATNTTITTTPSGVAGAGSSSSMLPELFGGGSVGPEFSTQGPGGAPGDKWMAGRPSVWNPPPMNAASPITQPSVPNVPITQPGVGTSQSSVWSMAPPSTQAAAPPTQAPPRAGSASLADKVRKAAANIYIGSPSDMRTPLGFVRGTDLHSVLLNLYPDLAVAFPDFIDDCRQPGSLMNGGGTFEFQQSHEASESGEPLLMVRFDGDSGLELNMYATTKRRPSSFLPGPPTSSSSSSLTATAELHNNTAKPLMGNSPITSGETPLGGSGNNGLPELRGLSTGPHHHQQQQSSRLSSLWRSGLTGV